MRVSVVTRTRDRPVFLRRALEGLRAQTCRDFSWIVVNDCGECEPVEAITAQARASGINVRLVHNTVSQGIEHAANIGIAADDGELIHIHDDDDTLEPAFYRACLDFLAANPSAQAVTSRVSEVHEIVEAGAVREVLRRPYVFQPRSVTLEDLAICNRFPPISLVFRRGAHDRIGGFDESLAVLGDWDFNLRLAQLGPIAVIARRLANYHVREPDSASHLNTIVGRRDLHLETTAAIYERYRARAPSQISAALAAGAQVEPPRASWSYRLRSLLLKLKRRLRSARKEG